MDLIKLENSLFLQIADAENTLERIDAEIEKEEKEWHYLKVSELQKDKTEILKNRILLEVMLIETRKKTNELKKKGEIK